MSRTLRLVLAQLVFIFLQSLLVDAKEAPNAVAFKCGKPALYLTALGWVPDEQQTCLHREQDIAAYCQRVYNNPSLVRVAFTPVIEVYLPDWCFPNRTDCPVSTENRTYPIQPWICSATPPPQLTVPVDCILKRIDDPRHEAYSCHKADYWLQAASQSCQSNRTILFNSTPIKPCIKVDAYNAMHYMGADIVCCAHPSSPYDHEATATASATALGANPTAFGGSLLGSADTSLIISNDERVYSAYLAAQNPETKAHENQQFKSAKAAEKEAYEQRKQMLQEQLAAAEARLSPEDWLANPERTQQAEDALHQELMRKYVVLEEEDRQMRHRLDSTHWNRVLASMEHRKRIVLDQWNKTLADDRSNLTQIKRAAEHLLHTIENQRAHMIRRFDRVRATDPVEARQMLPNVRQFLSDLEHLLSNSLAKLDKFPKLKPAVLEHVTQLRRSRYAQLDASAKAIAVMSATDTQDTGVRFPTPNEQAALDAAKLIAKYEHHYLPRTESKASASDGTSTAAASSSVAHHIKSSTVGRQSDRMSSRRPPASAETPRENRDKSHLAVVSYPKTNATESKGSDSTEDIVVEIHLPSESTTLPPVPLASTVGSHTQRAGVVGPPGQRRSKALIVLPIVLACIVFFVLVVFVARCYVHRMRRQRAGYNLTVVEVDEVANTDGVHCTRHGPHLPRIGRARPGSGSATYRGTRSAGLDAAAAAAASDEHNPADPLSRWQVNGYENPAYKFTEGGYAFSPAD